MAEKVIGSDKKMTVNGREEILGLKKVRGLKSLESSV